MRRHIIILSFLILIFTARNVCAMAAAVAEPGIHLDRISLPPGFKISLFAEGVKNARSLALGPGGTVFVGSRAAGAVYALPDANNDHRADEVIVLARGMNMPNGVAFRDGSLYVAEVSRIVRFDNVEARLRDRVRPAVVYDGFPDKRAHGWKYIAFGPDGLLYVPVGAPCNVCESDDPRFSSIMRLNVQSGRTEIFASGIRNTVGFDWHPADKVLWFTNNGRDMLGDDLPPDTLHRAARPGLHFGFPYCHAGDIADPVFGSVRPCSDFQPPELKLGPHVAALGMKFYTGDMFPPEYRGRIFIAEHGSWNRTSPIGYRITQAVFKPDGALEYRVFADGWLSGDKAWGRPVDIMLMPDGSLLVSDDRAGAIYRIHYER